MKPRNGGKSADSNFGWDSAYGLLFAGTFVYGLFGSWTPFMAVAVAPFAYAAIRYAYAWLTDGSATVPTPNA